MRALPRLIVLLALLSGGAVLAGRQPQEFQPPPELTPEQQKLVKERALAGNVHTYGKHIPLKETPVPWAAISLAGLVFLAAVPFAIRAYRNTSKELAGAHVVGSSRARQAEDEG